MPNGGVFGSGSGLHLQPTTPGTTDSGNFHISGTGIAGLFQTEDTAGNGRLLYGKGATMGTAVNSVVVGTGGVIASNGNSSMTVVGSFSSIQGAGTTNCSAIGASCNIAGGVGTANVDAHGTGLTVNVNGASRVYVAGGGGTVTTTGNTVVISPMCSVTGGTQTVLGANASVGGSSNVVIGNQNTCANPRTGCVIIGNSKTATQDNQILIGNRDFTTAGGTTTTVNDANANPTSIDGALIYTAITAPRTVQLPAANTVPLGFRILVSDQSGSVTGVNTITLSRAGGDTINGGASAVINTAFGCRELICDGVNKWTVIRSL